MGRAGLQARQPLDRLRRAPLCPRLQEAPHQDHVRRAQLRMLLAVVVRQREIDRVDPGLVFVRALDAVEL